MDRQPPPDLSLAVGHGARRMTYGELAQARGISLASARRLVRRHAWPRQVGNDAVMRVAVPLSEVQAHKPADSATTWPMPAQAGPGSPRPMPPADGPGTELLAQAMAQAIDSLREQLVIANGRAERADRRIDEERGRVDRAERLLEEEQKRNGELQASLADAVGAERIAHDEAAALRAELGVIALMASSAVAPSPRAIGWSL
jgi:hypothetical protein